MKESELLLLINALNYNLSNSNNLTTDEIKILNTYRRNHIHQIDSDLLKEMYLSSLIKINYNNNNCEEAKMLSNELIVFPAIKEDIRGFPIFPPKKTFLPKSFSKAYVNKQVVVFPFVPVIAINGFSI